MNETKQKTLQALVTEAVELGYFLAEEGCPCSRFLVLQHRESNLTDRMRVKRLIKEYYEEQVTQAHIRYSSKPSQRKTPAKKVSCPTENQVSTQPQKLRKFIKNHARLHETEESELVKLAQQGDISARNKLITAHLWCVEVQVSHSSSDADDMFQAGVEGLYNALKTFDPAKGSRFSSWAFKYIQKAISRAYRENIANPPTVPYTKGMLRDMMFAKNLTPQGYYFEAETTWQIDLVIEQLDERSRDIILTRHLADNTEALRKLAERYNISEQAIHKSEHKALNKFKELFTDIDLGAIKNEDRKFVTYDGKQSAMMTNINVKYTEVEIIDVLENESIFIGNMDTLAEELPDYNSELAEVA